MTLNQDTTIEKKLRSAMKHIDDLYLMGPNLEMLNAILRIANYAARQSASMSNAMLVKEGEQGEDQ